MIRTPSHHRRYDGRPDFAEQAKLSFGACSAAKESLTATGTDFGIAKLISGVPGRLHGLSSQKELSGT